MKKDTVVRDATIQRFEYCYELAVKLIQRYFQEKGTVANVDSLSFQELFRIAAEAGLVQDPEPWFQYRRGRNMTSHAYDEELAEEVFAIVAPFFKDATTLYQELQNRL